jgi:GLPGLI family protein
MYSLNAQSNKEISGYVQYLIKYPSAAANPKPVKTHFYFDNTKSISIDNLKGSEKESPSEGNAELTISLPYGDDQGRQIFRNLENKTLTTRRPKNFISDEFIVNENWVEISWDIKNDTKKVGSYLATKAVGSFRGATYIVWFSYDIPVPFGPWKLHGLPGLILEGEDSKKIMRFAISKITIPLQNTSRNLQVPTAKEVKTHKEEVYMLDNFDDLRRKVINAKMPQGHKMIAHPDHKHAGRKYKPEKIYEWEVNQKDEKKK